MIGIKMQYRLSHVRFGGENCCFDFHFRKERLVESVRVNDQLFGRTVNYLDVTTEEFVISLCYLRCAACWNTCTSRRKKDVTLSQWKKEVSLEGRQRKQIWAFCRYLQLHPDMIPSHQHCLIQKDKQYFQRQPFHNVLAWNNISNVNRFITSWRGREILIS